MLGIITYLEMSIFVWAGITSVRLSILGYLPIAKAVFENDGVFKYYSWYIGNMLEIAVPFWIVWLALTSFIVMINLKKLK